MLSGTLESFQELSGRSKSCS